MQWPQSFFGYLVMSFKNKTLHGLTLCIRSQGTIESTRPMLTLGALWAAHIRLSDINEGTVLDFCSAAQ